MPSDDDVRQQLADTIEAVRDEWAWANAFDGDIRGEMVALADALLAGLPIGDTGTRAMVAEHVVAPEDAPGFLGAIIPANESDSCDTVEWFAPGDVPLYYDVLYRRYRPEWND